VVSKAGEGGGTVLGVKTGINRSKQSRPVLQKGSKKRKKSYGIGNFSKTNAALDSRTCKEKDWLGNYG